MGGKEKKMQMTMLGSLQKTDPRGTRPNPQAHPDKKKLCSKVTPANGGNEIGTEVALLNTLEKKKLMDESLKRERLYFNFPLSPVHLSRGHNTENDNI